MKIHNEFANAFRKVRRARGLTQEDFFDESGRTYISELERGLKHPTLVKIDQLAGPLKLHPLTVLALSYSSKEDSMAALDKLLEQVRQEAEGIFQQEVNKQ
ncbi:helix-turn-helix transcriptional regulator [Janthinobacterium sp. SUN120]|uniref:helix-turn-helix domain-containing protein n=1 Tax=Janthinobacterium sp. SUN120 TaxID=3004099 RepID=UPI0025B240C4|nr:helix-turn-helix transcriptional regulator [Janthinobacterium sp. SUN120]MDN2716861.1 helix-turn-helix transcriptional regulator [Janthinobacterium sp. SUN120]